MVRSNYDTLTLKLHDSLDHFEKYAEKPKETTFFTHLVSGEAWLYTVPEWSVGVWLYTVPEWSVGVWLYTVPG